MNIRTASHFPEDVLENYALGKLSEQESAPIEEHLLICGTCQQVLSKLDEYLDVLRAALAEKNSASTSPPHQPVKKSVCSAGRP